mmetsp:Transcript_58698/g.96405  ORF Transcript_58698/g.96405 Transcript_58698/m.96405 type:complete len:116 (-) Transcript_58698:560-907(-)
MHMSLCSKCACGALGYHVNPLVSLVQRRSPSYPMHRHVALEGRSAAHVARQSSVMVLQRSPPSLPKRYKAENMGWVGNCHMVPRRFQHWLEIAGCLEDWNTPAHYLQWIAKLTAH